MKKEYINIPNCLTLSRLLGSFVLIFLKPLSDSFLIVYGVAGFTDAIDGFIARKTNCVTEFGSKLDSVADLSFYTIMMLKILTILIDMLPSLIWLFIIGTLIIRIIIYLIYAYQKNVMLSSHTFLNKATGLMMFILPFALKTPIAEGYCWATVGVAVVAAVYEFMCCFIKTYE